MHWAQRGSHGHAVFEESARIDLDITKGLARDGERDYRAIAQIYQQLKKNYDTRLDYCRKRVAPSLFMSPMAIPRATHAL